MKVPRVIQYTERFLILGRLKVFAFFGSSQARWKNRALLPPAAEFQCPTEG
jgi:hypothetical protein